MKTNSTLLLCITHLTSRVWLTFCLMVIPLSINAGEAELAEKAYKAGDYFQSIRHYEAALKKDLETHGENHSNVSTYYNKLGVAYDAGGDYINAIKYFKLGLGVALKTYREDHPKVITWRYMLGLTNYNLGNYPKAIEYLKWVNETLLNDLGADHPTTKIVKAQLDTAIEDSKS